VADRCPLTFPVRQFWTRSSRKISPSSARVRSLSPLQRGDLAIVLREVIRLLGMEPPAPAGQAETGGDD
jgi:hypothetical protein